MIKHLNLHSGIEISVGLVQHQLVANALLAWDREISDLVAIIIIDLPKRFRVSTSTNFEIGIKNVSQNVI